MMGLLLAALSAKPIEVTAARPVTKNERVVGQGLTFRCDLSIEGEIRPWHAALDGEIAGVGKGPLTLDTQRSSGIDHCRSSPGSISYDDTLAVADRPLFVSLDTQFRTAAKPYRGTLAFTYRQNAAAPTRLAAPERILAARMTVYKAGDIVRGAVLDYPRQGARPVASAACTSSLRNPQ
jgi:hypothetical protein